MDIEQKEKHRENNNKKKTLKIIIIIKHNKKMDDIVTAAKLNIPITGPIELAVWIRVCTPDLAVMFDVEMMTFTPRDCHSLMDIC